MYLLFIYKRCIRPRLSMCSLDNQCCSPVLKRGNMGVAKCSFSLDLHGLVTVSFHFLSKFGTLILLLFSPNSYNQVSRFPRMYAPTSFYSPFMFFGPGLHIKHWVTCPLGLCIKNNLLPTLTGPLAPLLISNVPLHELCWTKRKKKSKLRQCDICRLLPSPSPKT